MPGNVEVSLPAGGDFSLQPNGDLVLVIDVPNVVEATKQRIIRLILTNPRLQLADGQFTNPDDICNVNYGSGARALVGQPITDALERTLQARVFKGLSDDPTIASSPLPTVSVERTGTYTISVSVTCYAVTGEVIVIPSLALSAV